MCLKPIVFCFVFLFCAEFLVLSEALKSGDDGVCTVKISVRKTRSKMVTINKWCGKKKCVVRKIESYMVPEERIVCCNGWEYNVNTDACAPICSTGCSGGRCIAPEVCHCDPPATLDIEHKNICIQPTCDPPCINAQCQLNNTCQCHPTFSVYNLTHCFKCENGYTIDKDFNCVPICDKTCVHSNCTAPNICTCMEGYKRKTDHVCEPVCNICVNSTCVGPNECFCLDGYERLNDTICVPKCDNCDGDCVAPNMCNCRAGFENIDGVCKPVCPACENGVCVSGECFCNDGYTKNGSALSSCVKICDRPSEVEERS